MLDMTAQYPHRLIPFCNLDPRMLTNSTKADFRTMLQTFRTLGFKGIGEYIPNLPFDDPLNMNVFAQVEESGFPLLFHLAPAIGGCYGVYDDIGFPRLETVLRAFPRLVFIGHSQAFWAEISTNVTAQNRGKYPTGPVTPGSLVRLMRDYPNLHGDLSAGSGFNAISRDEKFGDRFLEEFQDRLYFGTDIAYIPQELPQVAYFETLRAQARISAEAIEKICWKNARRLLSLDTPAVT